MTVVGLHPEELFDKLLEGELSVAERERLQAHLEACEVCRFEYAARLDFQAEALELGAASPPPTLPLRPLHAADVFRPRQRRSRRVVWSLAAALLITASGAVASSVVGKTPWRAAASLFSQSAAPAERPARASARPAPARVVGSSAQVVVAPPVVAPLADAPAVTSHEPPVRARERVAEQANGARANGVATAPTTGDLPNVSAKDGVAKENAVKEPASAAKLFGEANQARRSGDVGRASGLYHLLQDQFPGSPEAELSRVTLALLLLDSGDAQGALNGFERYLAGSSRGLEAEALVGRARALGRLGRRDLEATAWREVQRKYPSSIYGRQAGERLSALGQP
jgi:TolA-binding protein